MNGLKELRQLAYQYRLAAESPVNTRRMELHRAVNDLKMIRPVVLIDEIPFLELNFDGSLTTVCDDPLLKNVEGFLRQRLFQWKYFPADMILTPFVPVYKVMHSTGNGLHVEENIIKGEGYIHSHEYHDQLANDEALEKVHLPVITYDEAATMANYTRITSAIGDLIPVKIVGYDCYTAPWDQIATYRGVTQLLYDLVDEPEFTHRIVEKIYACEESRLSQMEELGLFELNSYSLHCTASLCSDLPEYDGGKVLRKHVWGRGMAQIFSSVSKAMHDEFDIQYMKKLMEPFGLVYYGCCEPLDRKIDIVEKLPHLRKIGVSPWADVDVACEAIGKKYVVANKPNPAAVGIHLDEDALRKEIGRTLSAVKRNGCSCDIVLKDISSAGHDLNNLVRWEQIVMEMVQDF